MRFPWKAVVLGGLIGGALDLAFALCWAGYNGMPPVALLQVVASGAFGAAAREGGVPMAFAGAICHFGLSLLWAALFAFAAGRVAALRTRPLLVGALFGIVVFLAMRLVVLPLSAYPNPVRFTMPGALYDLLSHMFLFGVPIAWCRARFSRH